MPIVILGTREDGLLLKLQRKMTMMNWNVLPVVDLVQTCMGCMEDLELCG
jgi:hypothetical protein